MFKGGFDNGGWTVFDEDGQYAFINYTGGREKMILRVGFDGDAKGVLWLFPVPADPEKVTLDVVKSFPELDGYDISDKAESNVKEIRSFLFRIQIYSVLYGSGFEAKYGTASSHDQAAAMGVTVYEHLEKDGITSEIVTAKTAEGLYDYLHEKGLNISQGAVPVLDGYIGKDYSFVISWFTAPYDFNVSGDIKRYLDEVIFPYHHEFYIFQPKYAALIDSLKEKYSGFKKAASDVDFLKSPSGAAVMGDLISVVEKDPSTVVRRNEIDSKSFFGRRGVFVTFPTNKLYFPLIPTSVYGNRAVPANIKVVGHVAPEVFEEIERYTKVKYRIDDDAEIDKDLKDFCRRPRGKLAYTEISINAPSKYLTEDLWISRMTPSRVRFTSMLALYPGVFKIVLLVLCSALSGLIVGMILFRELRRRPGKLVLLGLFNCLTLAGVIIAAVLTRTKQNDENVEEILDELSTMEYVWQRRWALALFMAAAFLMLFSLVPVYFLLNSYYIAGPLATVIVLYTSAAIILITGMRFSNIYPEDREVFKKLEKANFSTWTFNPRDNMKVVFIAFFSVVFLSMCWYACDLLSYIAGGMI